MYKNHKSLFRLTICFKLYAELTPFVLFSWLFVAYKFTHVPVKNFHEYEQKGLQVQIIDCIALRYLVNVRFVMIVLLLSQELNWDCWWWFRHLSDLKRRLSIAVLVSRLQGYLKRSLPQRHTLMMEWRVNSCHFFRAVRGVVRKLWTSLQRFASFSRFLRRH